MSEDLMLKCLIAFILGWLASRMMGNGFSVGGWGPNTPAQRKVEKHNAEQQPLHLLEKYISPEMWLVEGTKGVKSLIHDF